eukprot:392859-Prymnesium_polylepis.1
MPCHAAQHEESVMSIGKLLQASEHLRSVGGTIGDSLGTSIGHLSGTVGGSLGQLGGAVSGAVGEQFVRLSHVGGDAAAGANRDGGLWGVPTRRQDAQQRSFDMHGIGMANLPKVDFRPSSRGGSVGKCKAEPAVTLGTGSLGAAEGQTNDQGHEGGDGLWTEDSDHESEQGDDNSRSTVTLGFGAEGAAHRTNSLLVSIPMAAVIAAGSSFSVIKEEGNDVWRSRQASCNELTLAVAADVHSSAVRRTSGIASAGASTSDAVELAF